MDKEITIKASLIKLILTDVDGVLTDSGVYFSERGEEMKRFSVRDGMGVERLRKLAGIDTGIITGELSPAVYTRAEKLNITELHSGIKDKLNCLKEIALRLNLESNQIAFIGDDVNDLEVIGEVGLSACPSDAMDDVAARVHFKCSKPGGYGAFREFSEFIIAAQTNHF